MSFENTLLDFIADIDESIFEDITQEIKIYDIHNTQNIPSSIHPIETKASKIKKIFEDFCSKFPKEYIIQVVADPECTFFEGMADIRNYLYACYYPPRLHDPQKTQDIDTESYTTILENLQKSIRSVNYIFLNKTND
jgi:hypothetical protein